MNLAERLGFDPDDRVLILNADDVGSTHASNVATFECLEQGSLTSGSILVPAPWFREAAAYACEHPEADLGVHLTLTSEYAGYRWRPLTDRSLAPGLYDGEGYLWHTAAGAIEHISPKEAELELRAQIDAAQAAGVDVTHLDTHMGTVLQPKFIDVYVSLGMQYSIPLFVFRPNPDRLHRSGLSDYWAALEPQLQRLDQAGFPVLDHILVEDLDRPIETKESFFKEQFADLWPGLTHFLCHPAKLSEETTALSKDAAARNKNYELFRDRSMAEELVRLGIKTITYREIREASRSGSLRNEPAERENIAS